MANTKEVRDAVLELRTRLKLTQTQFGNIIGKGLATVQRYETLVAPKGTVLNKLMILSAEHNHQDITGTFGRAFSEEFGATDKQVKCWTVIALHDSTGEVYTCVQNVAEPHEAIAITAREIKTRDGWDDVQIVCAVAGDCVTIPPCEDANKACYVADLGGDE